MHEDPPDLIYWRGMWRTMMSVSNCFFFKIPIFFRRQTFDVLSELNIKDYFSSLSLLHFSTAKLLYQDGDKCPFLWIKTNTQKRETKFFISFSHEPEPGLVYVCSTDHTVSYYLLWKSKIGLFRVKQNNRPEKGFDHMQPKYMWGRDGGRLAGLLWCLHYDLLKKIHDENKTCYTSD